ncbi:MAG TPA: Gfo/Idh/MocA family oxidoreductase [Candidatus Latescibacteria bacterium]|nr:Gfo/Idh/MocA family oxidoreductase [Candidatus Latescibacterota bacterium]
MAVRIGFIGCGGIANHHMRTMAGNPDAEMVAFSDPDVERARAAAKQYGGKAYSSYRTMISKGGIDAVFMCVPPFAHTDQEKLVAEAGLAFFTEKPIGLSLKRVAENAELFAKKGIITAVGYNWRYSDGAAMMKKTLDGKKLAVVSGYWVGGTPGVMWWRQMKKSGGQVVEQTTHIFDMCRYVAGEIDVVFASGISGLTSQDELPLYDVHDASVVQLRYRSGAVGNITSSCIVSQGVGTQVRAYARNLVVVVGEGRCQVSIPGEEHIYKDARNPTAHEQEAFLCAVAKKNGPPILSDYADAMKTLRVTLAANKSMETGKPVKLA